MPDHPLTKEILDAYFQLLDAKWEVFEGDHVGRKNTALTACMLSLDIMLLCVVRKLIGLSQEESTSTGTRLSLRRATRDTSRWYSVARSSEKLV